MDRIQKLRFGHLVTDFSGLHGRVKVADHFIFFKNFIVHRNWKMLKHVEFFKLPPGSHYVVDLDRRDLIIPEGIEFGGKEIEALRIAGMQFVEHSYRLNKIEFDYKFEGLGN